MSNTKTEQPRTVARLIILDHGGNILSDRYIHTWFYRDDPLVGDEFEMNYEVPTKRSRPQTRYIKLKVMKRSHWCNCPSTMGNPHDILVWRSPVLTITCVPATTKSNAGVHALVKYYHWINKKKRLQDKKKK